MKHEIGILVTSCEWHIPDLEKCMEAYRRLGYPVILGWDGEKNDLAAKVKLRNIKILATGKQLGKQEGERWQILHGTRRLARLGCKYVFKSCGDVLIERPEKIDLLISKLGENDFICNEWDERQRHFGTMVFFGKTQKLVRLAEAAEKKIKSGHKAKHIEILYGETAAELGYKFKPCDWELWKELLVCQHLQPS